jgi:aspartate/methionine/tyrosine aminotransferase
MKHPSLYLDWYSHVPKVKYDLRSSGISNFRHQLPSGDIDLSTGYLNGNPETAKALAQRYHTGPENVFISSEGATGQNSRIIRYLAEKDMTKNEAIVEYPTYEPLLRIVQEYFPHVKRLERKETEVYRLDADALRNTISEKTALLLLTNSHAPSGAIASASELKEITDIAHENGVYVVCDEIYAEFNRDAIPTVFSVDEEFGVVTTSFTKAYGLGGLRLGVALANKNLVTELYKDVLNTVGSSPNVVQLVALELLTKGKEMLERHKQKWTKLKEETEAWLEKKDIDYLPNKAGVTYWMKLPIKDTYRWINEHTIPRYNVAPVPGALFLFRDDYQLVRSNMVRLGLGAVDPDDSNLSASLEALEKAAKSF